MGSTAEIDEDGEMPLHVVVVDADGVDHHGRLDRLGPAFIEIDLTEADEQLQPDDPVHLRAPGIDLDRPGRVVRAGRHLVVQLAATRERRTNLRVPYSRPVRWRLEGTSIWHAATGEDLSSAGIRILADSDPGIGSRIDIDLPILGRASVDVVGEVLAVIELGRWYRIRARFSGGRSPAVTDVIGRVVHELR